MEEGSASAKIQQEANDLIKNEDQGASSVIDITQMEESLQPCPSFECCIYKVSDPLRKLNEKAYTPQVISIGPFHHGNEKLKTMEEYKASYLKKFIERAKIENKCKDDLERIVKDFVDSVRHCYAETTDHLSRDDFVRIILTDAGFIIELFIRNMFDDWSSDDKIKLKPLLAARMQLDFILLENQLPFFIINKLFDLAFPSRSGFPSFVELTFEYFSSYNKQEMSHDPEWKILHFADLARKFCLPRCLPDRELEIIEHMYTATQLVGVGLKFEVDRSSNCLLDLDYKKGVLKIPRFILEDHTELYVRNILALEQYLYPNRAYVTDYFILLNFFLKDEKDFDLFRQQGILAIGLGNKDVTNFINNLGTGMIYSSMNSKYYDICIKLRKFYEEPGWVEYMRRNYFGTALRVVASTITILTFIQTVGSIISLVLPQ